jgi:hypothetical protein
VTRRCSYSSDEVNFAGAKVVSDLESAIAALTEIVVEGEGAPEHRENSHFQRFLSVRDEMLRYQRPIRLLSRRTRPRPIRSFANRRSRMGMCGWRMPMRSRRSISPMRFTGLRCGCSRAPIALPRPNPDKALYVGCAIGLMHALTAVAERAARLPAGPSNPGCHAGVSFTALRDAAPLPAGRRRAAPLYRTCRRTWGRSLRPWINRTRVSGAALRIIQKQAARLKARTRR